MTTYSDKLKSPRWQKKRLEILNLRSFKCELCGCEEKELHVHHRFYLKGREVWQYDNDVFQVLCCDCHEKEHKSKDKIIEVIPERYKELINNIEKFRDINLKSLCIFIELMDSGDQFTEIFELLSCAINNCWLDKSLEYIKDQRKIENLEIGLIMIHLTNNY